MEYQMIVCKIKCPSCGADHDVPYDSLSEAKSLECTLCGHDFPLSSEGKPKEAKAKVRKSKSKTQIDIKCGNHSARKKTSRKLAPKRKKNDTVSSKYIINASVIGLSVILLFLVIFKLAGSKEENNVALIDEPKSTMPTLVKNEVEVKNKFIDAQKATIASAVVKPAPVVVETPGTKIQENTLIVQEAVNAPEFGKRTEKVPVEVSQYEEPKKTEPVPVSLVTNQTPSKNMILIESEQAEMDELRKIPGFKLTAEEKETLKELMSKYQWYKANRFKLNRDEMDEAWERRWSEIVASNVEAKGRTDAMLSRPLQILLEGKKTIKERAYMMRIYQKPISFEEKELVKKARAQAQWEKRKEEAPIKYPEDKRKKKNQKYTDEYGYEYYLNDKGQRIYL